jgi:hypothetical protein
MEKGGGGEQAWRGQEGWDGSDYGGDRGVTSSEKGSGRPGSEGGGEKREQNYMGGGNLHPAMPKASRERICDGCECMIVRGIECA